MPHRGGREVPGQPGERGDRQGFACGPERRDERQHPVRPPGVALPAADLVGVVVLQSGRQVPGLAGLTRAGPQFFQDVPEIHPDTAGPLGQQPGETRRFQAGVGYPLGQRVLAHCPVQEGADVILVLLAALLDPQIPRWHGGLDQREASAVGGHYVHAFRQGDRQTERQAVRGRLRLVQPVYHEDHRLAQVPRTVGGDPQQFLEPGRGLRPCRQHATRRLVAEAVVPDQLGGQVLQRRLRPAAF